MLYKGIGLFANNRVKVIELTLNSVTKYVTETNSRGKKTRYKLDYVMNQPTGIMLDELKVINCALRKLPKSNKSYLCGVVGKKTIFIVEVVKTNGRTKKDVFIGHIKSFIRRL